MSSPMTQNDLQRFYSKKNIDWLYQGLASALGESMGIKLDKNEFRPILIEIMKEIVSKQPSDQMSVRGLNRTVLDTATPTFLDIIRQSRARSPERSPRSQRPYQRGCRSLQKNPSRKGELRSSS